MKCLFLLLSSRSLHVTQAKLQLNSSLKQCPYLIQCAPPSPFSLLASSNDTSLQANGRWSDLASKDRTVPQKPDAGLGPDVASWGSLQARKAQT